VFLPAQCLPLPRTSALAVSAPPFRGLLQGQPPQPGEPPRPPAGDVLTGPPRAAKRKLLPRLERAHGDQRPTACAELASCSKQR
jgi:hypothetical protein